MKTRFCAMWCRTNTVDEIARHLVSEGELPRLTEMLADVRTLGEIRGGMYAGSFIGYVRAAHGIDAVRSLWTDGTDSFAEVLGVSVEEIEAAWKEYLEKTVDDDAEVDYEAIGESGCG